MPRFATLVLTVLLSLASLAAHAQGYSLVGTWSAQTTNTRGQSTGSIFATYNPNGSFVQRWVIPRGTVDYAGNYRLSPDGSTLQSIYRDYSPKQSCAYGACYPVVPVVQMNTPVTTYIRWIRANLFVTEDAGGAVRWIRQR
jgi:hypothetical protein